MRLPIRLQTGRITTTSAAAGCCRASTVTASPPRQHQGIVTPERADAVAQDLAPAAQGHEGVARPAEHPRGRQVDGLDRVDEAPAPRHDVEVRHGPTQQPARAGRVRGEAEGRRCRGEADGIPPGDGERQPFAVEHRQGPVDAGKGREGPVRGDPRHADPPVEGVEPRARRMGQEFDRLAAAVLPRHRAPLGGPEDADRHAGAAPRATAMQWRSAPTSASRTGAAWAGS